MRGCEREDSGTCSHVKNGFLVKVNAGKHSRKDFATLEDSRMVDVRLDNELKAVERHSARALQLPSMDGIVDDRMVQRTEELFPHHRSFLESLNFGLPVAEKLE